MPDIINDLFEEIERSAQRSALLFQTQGGMQLPRLQERVNAPAPQEVQFTLRNRSTNH